jgi:hypothetical protein
MKLKYIPLIGFLAVLFTNCKKDSQLELKFDEIRYVYKDECKQDQCAEVNIEYIKSVGGLKVSEKINNTINEYIISSLNYNIDDPISTPTIETAAKRFLEAYKRDKDEFPEISPYFAEINVTNTYKSESLICFEMRQYLYTGGAHGYGSTWYLNINRKSGEELSVNDILNNEDSFKNYAEKVFREKLLIPEGGSINATGFWFDDDTFYLPETIGFQDSNVILLYNPYDIASYADGPIEIVIPIADIESYLKAK